MPALRRIRAPLTRRVDRHIDAPERATQSTRTHVPGGTAMDVPECDGPVPEPMSPGRCRALLGDEAHGLSDDEVIDVARHADAMARVLIALALQDGHVH